jgi:CBS domain-containing protein
MWQKGVWQMSVDMPTAADLMSRTVVSLRPDMTLAEAIRILVRYEISGAPVVDGDERLVGLLSEHDCLRVTASGDYTAEDLALGDPVATHMSRPAYVVESHIGIYSIAHIFLVHRIRRLPVVDGDRLVGLIARRDVLRGLLAMSDRRGSGPGRRSRGVGLFLSATGKSVEVIAGRLK